MRRPVPETVCVIGLGYIGLPTAAAVARAGTRVIGVDVKQDSIDAVNAGRIPFVEAGLEEVVTAAVASGMLSAQREIPHADAFIVTVPTPFLEGHEADLSFIEDAARSIAPQLRGGELIILESTSPPGTTEAMADLIHELRPDLSGEADTANRLHFAHAPERVLPGRIMQELVENDRIIGGLTPEAGERTRDLYATFSTGELLLTDTRTAELAKLTENAFRDVNIAFANELSIIAERQNIDVWELIELANRHPRVNILQPGPGVGGHCIAVDPWFIVSAEREHARLIKTAREVNDSKPGMVIATVIEAASRILEPTVAALGIAFKADIDDLRESPSRDIVNTLSEQLTRGTVLVVEPNIGSLPEDLSEQPNIRLEGLADAVAAADIVLLLVDHQEFYDLDRALLADKIVIDTKGMWR